MPGHEELKTLLEAGAMVFGSDGEKIGTLGHINLDDRTGIPDFVTVHTGFLGSAESFVPLNEAEISNGNLFVKFPKDFVKDAPEIDPAVALSAEDEGRLYRYYSQAGAGNLHTVADTDPRQATVEPDPQGNADATTPGEHAVHVIRERHVIRVAGVLHDDFAPGLPRLKKGSFPGPGAREPDAGPDPSIADGSRADAADPEVGQTPRGRRPEERFDKTSKSTSPNPSGGSNRPNT